jgi:hypothetical protein
LSIASNIQWYALIPHKAYSFITTLLLGPFDDVITKFYCIYIYIYMCVCVCNVSVSVARCIVFSLVSFNNGYVIVLNEICSFDVDVQGEIEMLCYQILFFFVASCVRCTEP